MTDVQSGWRVNQCYLQRTPGFNTPELSYSRWHLNSWLLHLFNKSLFFQVIHLLSLLPLLSWWLWSVQAQVQDPGSNTQHSHCGATSLTTTHVKLDMLRNTPAFTPHWFAPPIHWFWHMIEYQRDNTPILQHAQLKWDVKTSWVLIHCYTSCNQAGSIEYSDCLHSELQHLLSHLQYLCNQPTHTGKKYNITYIPKKYNPHTCIHNIYAH